MAGAHYPRLSPSADAWCAGDTQVLVNGATIGPGRQPQWQDDDTIIALAPAQGVWRYRRGEAGTWSKDDLAPEARGNDLSVSAFGWAYVTTVPSPRVVCWTGRAFEGFSAVAISPAGVLALGRHEDGSLWIADSVRDDPRPFMAQPCRDLRWTDAGLSFTAYTPKPQVWTWYGGTAMSTSVTAPEFAAATAVGPMRLHWVLSNDDTRLLFRVDSSVVGYILGAQGNTYTPDVRWHETRQRFRVVWATKDGQFQEAWVNPNDPRVDLRVEPPPPPPPPPDEPEKPNMEYASFRWSAASFHKCASDVGDWPIVLRLDDAYVPAPEVKGIVTEWRNVRDWPSTDPGPGPGLVGNCGIIAKIDGAWRVATYDWLRYPDQDSKDESLTTVRLEQINEEPWRSWRPQVGEVVGLFVCTPARSEHRTVNQRSAVAWVKVGQRGILAHEGDSPPPPPPPPDEDDGEKPPAEKPVDLTPVLKGLEALSTGLLALTARVDRLTAIQAEWAGELHGQVKAVGDAVDATHADLHALTQATQKQIENLSLPLNAKVKLFGQAAAVTGTVGRP